MLRRSLAVLLLFVLILNAGRADIAYVYIQDPSSDVRVNGATMSVSSGSNCQTTSYNARTLPGSNTCSWEYSYSICDEEGEWKAKINAYSYGCTSSSGISCSSQGWSNGAGSCSLGGNDCMDANLGSYATIYYVDFDKGKDDTSPYNDASGWNYTGNCCKAAGYYWNIGGESSATSCCEDSNEERRVSAYDSSMDGTADGTDACCYTENGPKCVDANTCYNTGSTSHDADGDGDDDYCSSGTWYDCNADNTESECSSGQYCSGNDCVAKKANGAACTHNVQCSSGICDLDGCGLCVSTATDTDGDGYNDDSSCDACPTDPDDHGGASGSCETKIAGLIVMDDRSGSSIELYAEGTQWTPDTGDFSEKSTDSFEGTYSTHNRGSWVRKSTSYDTATYPRVVFAYKIDNTEIACLMVHSGSTWYKIADTPTTCSSSYSNTAHAATLINDGKWHVESVNISDVSGTVDWIISGGTGDIYLDNVYAIKDPVIYSKPTNTPSATPGTKLIVYSVCTDDDGPSDIGNHANLINYQDDDSSPNRGYYHCSGTDVAEYSGTTYGQQYSELLTSESSCWTKGDANIMKAVLRTEGQPSEYGEYVNDISLRCQGSGEANCWKHNSANNRVYTEAATPACETTNNNYDVDFQTYDCPAASDGEDYCNATMSCDDGDNQVFIGKCELKKTLARGVIDTTDYASGTERDLSFLTDISTTSDACIMYDVYDAESSGIFDLYVGKTKVADAEGGGNNVWMRYRFYDVSSYVSTGQNLWEFDDDVCCHIYDNLLFGWLVSETGSGADGSSSTSCCDDSTDCVDDYVKNETWGCYDTGTQRDTGGGDGADLEECRSGVWYAQDDDSTACTNIQGAGHWNLGGNGGDSSACCGDDSTDYLITETSDSDAPSNFVGTQTACCDTSTDCVDDSDNCVDTGTAYGTVPQRAYCAGSNTWQGGDDSSTACTAIAGASHWNRGGEVAATTCCGDDSGENLNTETQGTDAPALFDDGTDACCDLSTDCVEADTCYADGATTGTIPNKGYCSSGSWLGGDASQTVCDAIVGANHWNRGGEVDATTCCEDDSGENLNTETQGTDAPALFDDGTDACCDLSTDCVEADTCYADGATTGTIPNKGYCSSGTWLGGDASETACTAIAGAGRWMNSKCCGDEPASSEDDFENSGSGNSCCIDGVVVSSDSLASGYANEILCYDGEAYSCNRESEFSFDTDYITNAKVGSHYCTDSGWDNSAQTNNDYSKTVCEDNGNTWFGGESEEACCESGETFVAEFVPEDGIAAKFKFDEGTGTAAYYRPGGLMGTVSSATWEAGRTVSGKALRFDGVNDYVEIQDYPEMKLDQNLTLAFWMYPESVGTSRQNPLDKSYGGEFALTLENSANGVGKMHYYHGTARSGGNYWTWTAFETGNFTNNTWYFVAITRNNATHEMKSYKNGKLMASTTYSLENARIPSTSTYPVTIGYGYAGGFVGVIDEVMIFNRTLSEDEIDILYRSYPEANQMDLKGYWPFNDNMNDYSAYSNTLTNNGATFVTGKEGSALNFAYDGTYKYATVTDSSLDITDDITLTMWVKPDINTADDTGSTWWHIFARMEGAKFESGYYGTAGPRFKPYNDAGSTFDTNAGLDLDAGTWYFVGFVKNGSSVGVYVNGRLEAQRNDFTGTLKSGTQLNIGGLATQGNFNGSIDDFRIYGQALSPSEIQFLYQQEKWQKYACESGAKTECSGSTCANTSSKGSYYYCVEGTFKKYSMVQDDCQTACEAYGGIWKGKGGDENCCSPLQSYEAWCDGTGSVCSGGTYATCDEWCDINGGTIGGYTCTSDRDYDCSSIGSCSEGVCPCALSSTKTCTDDSQCGDGNCVSFKNAGVDASMGSWGDTPSDAESICCEANACVYDSDGNGFIDSCAVNGTDNIDVDGDGDSDFCYEGTWRECLDYSAENSLASDCACSLGSMAVDSGGWVCRVSPVDTGAISCGSPCDSDSNSGTEEMVDRSGLCNLVPDVCTNSWYTATWEGNTSLLDVQVNISCPCNSYAYCNVSVGGDSGVVYAGGFTAPNGELTHHVFNPNLNYNYNNVSINCSCYGVGQECRRELDPAFVLTEETINPQLCLAGQSCLTSISIENTGSVKAFYNLTMNTSVQSSKATNTSAGYAGAGETSTEEFYNKWSCSDVVPTWQSLKNYTAINYDYALDLADVSYVKNGSGTGWLVQCNSVTDCQTCYSSEGNYWAFGAASNFSCSDNVCCGSGEHFMNGACCTSNQQCCLTDDVCDSGEWCDNYTSTGGYSGKYYQGQFYCTDTKGDGSACYEDRECINSWCGGGICADSNPVPLSEWFECKPQVSGILCDYEAAGSGPKGCNGDSYCSEGSFCYTPRHACLQCPRADSEFGGINMSKDGLCPSSNCVGYDFDCCVADANCSSTNWCDATSTCRACSTQKDVICSSSNCVGIDPDCCSTAADCASGEECSGGTCIGNVGEDCNSDSDCTSGLECVGGTCLSRNFMTIVPEAPASGYYNASVGDILKYTILVANPQQTEDTFTVQISTSTGHDAGFARIDNDMSRTFRLGSGSTEKLLLTVFAGRQALAPSDALTIVLKANSTSNTLLGDSITVKIDVKSKLAEGMPKAPASPALLLLLAGLAIGLATLR